MTDNRMTLSIDTIYLEVYVENGREYVQVSPSNLQGRGQGVIFPKGDETEGLRLLSKISKLIGLNEVKADESSKT